MVASLLQRQYLPAMGAYLEIVERPDQQAPLSLRYNWNMAQHQLGSHMMEFECFSDAEEAYKQFERRAQSAPEIQKLQFENDLTRLISRNYFDGFGYKWRNRSLRHAFGETGFMVDIYDPLKSSTYGFAYLVDTAIGKKTVTRAQAETMIEAICTRYGLEQPSLYFGDDVASYAGEILEKDKQFASALLRDGVEGVCDYKAGNLFIVQPRAIVVLHEMAHWVERHASEASLYHHHGERYNRVFLQILDQMVDLDSQELFEAMRMRGLFRQEMSYDEVMAPIDLLKSTVPDEPGY